MARRLLRLKSMVLAFCAATALVAQVDSKLLTTTDLLDVYKSGGGMAEMVTIFDMSGSMVNAFWHAKYWTDQNSDQGNAMKINTTTGVVTIDIGNSVTATGYLVEPSGTKITTTPITAAVIKRASHARLTAAVTGTVGTGSTSYSYTINGVTWSNSSGGRATFSVTTTPSNLSSGDVVVVAGMSPAGYNGTYTITNKNNGNKTFQVSLPSNPGVFVSGGTVTVQRVTSISGTYTRTLDIPVPWTLLQVPSTLPTLPSAGTAPVPDFAVDPKSGSSVVYDTYYSLASANVLDTGNSPATIGFYTYNADYIYWLFWGNVVKANDGNSYNTTPPGGYKDDRNQSPIGGVFATGAGTFSGSPYNGTYPSGGGFIIPGVYDPASGSSSAASTTVYADGRGTTFNNGIPVGTRSMFLKKAVLATWFAKQDKVLWAYRFLDESNETSTPFSDNFGTANRNLTRLRTVTTGIDASVTTIQKKFPQDRTPLTRALANTYAQLINSGINATAGSNPGNVFDKVNTGIDPSPCRASFVIIFTDGMANTDTIGPREVNLSTTPPTAVLGESVLQAIPYSSLNESSGQNFNLWSLAAVAAHGLDNGTANATQKTTGSGNPSAYAPFRIMTRGSEGTSGRKITTMTVGLSLAGSNTSDFTVGGKGPLLRTALYGDPANTNTSSYTAKFDLINSVAYGKTPLATTGIATNFFDASDPDALIGSLSTIIARVTQANTSITAPAAPLVGLNLGNRAYLGRFSSTNAGTGSGSIWQGDLLMTGLGIQSDGTVGLKDRSGNFQVDINVGNAVASASSALLDSTRGWKGRNIYTAIPGTDIPSDGLALTALAQAFSEANTLLTPKVMGVATDADAAALIRFIRGASVEAQADSSKSTSRADIMGDIVNSSPAAVEYDPTLIPSGSRLSGLWGSTYSKLTDARFQMIFVGDNQGHFHAFGEVSGLDGSGILQADLDELWSFVPTELLNNPSVATTVPKLSLLKASGADHIYTVDGSPYIYFNDSPLTGSPNGNRRVDSSDTIRVIVGMRKGGRSYYAFDVLNPGAPKLAWMLDPNNATNPAIKSMGLATSTPSVARVEMGSPAVVKDLVFIGGGYSNNELDALTIGGNSSAVKLGRSLLALDVLDGTIIKAYDFVNNGTLATKFPNMGAIAAGSFPLEFYVGSKKAQRVYFGDQSGGVYALGSMQTLSTAPVGWRMDYSNIDKWTTDGVLNVSDTPGTAGIRWIYKGAITLTNGKVTSASPISSTPVAFRVPKAIPQFRRSASSANAPSMVPPVVGVTFGTGDRNDPMDLDPIGPVSSASFRQVMVFDRQDSADLPTSGGLPSNVNVLGSAITDALLSDQTSNTTPGDTSYLGTNQYLGYFLRFHSATTDPLSNKSLYEKSYLNSVVTNGGLVFSTFRPGNTASSVVCQGAGTTYTFRLCDALSPVFGNGDLAATGTTDKQLTGCNGWVFAWTNLAGDLTSIGSRMVIQSGQDSPVSGTPTSSNVKIQDLVVQSGPQAFAPRAWRIVR